MVGIQASFLGARHERRREQCENINQPIAKVNDFKFTAKMTSHEASRCLAKQNAKLAM